ncbi:protein AF-10-like [Achroia grisella]|uniref:protein AF-10-like n=1 Tax=Achroia grisella TaxID=688607 RepID=UPI0027D27ECA|nr:protein AF-10-like [Achroia grisella]
MKEKDMIGGCCVCSDERGWPDNPLVYCDGNGCTVAVHQACYGIVTVPTGPWYCRKCESPETKGKVRCELCPAKSGALKRTDTGGWAHVVCALYIPEVRFGNVTSMEPIVLRLIPPERYNKTCYICQESGKSHRATAGACMQCNKSGCRLYAHVTCAQRLGLLCEEAGNYLDNVKYCGYCQHHYSKLKKGGNVKTIPPYKPVSHDSQSSDSSCEKEGEASPMAGGSGTPTHTTKSKGPGRKSSHNSNAASGKNTPGSSKTPTNTSQPMEINQDNAEVPTVGRKHKASEKNKKKPSPSRRGSSAGDAGGSGSKNTTPAPSPQHPAAEHAQAPSGKSSGGTTPGAASKVAPPSASPSSIKAPEAVGVISSVASATAASVSTVTATVPSTSVTTSVVQVPTTKSASYQETVITNTESMETKQTKKRKAVSAANNPAPVDYTAPQPVQQPNEANTQGGNNMWETPHIPNDTQMDTVEKIIKKAKTDLSGPENVPVSHFSTMSPAPPPPPPPPAHSPASQPSPRHLPSPMPGPSGLNTMSNIRSPSQPQGVKGDRDVAVSLLVSVPLPSTSHGLNLSAHAQASTSAEHCGPSPHIFLPPQKQAAMDPGMPAHPPLAVPGRSTWGGLNVTYEMQQDPNKPGVSGLAGPSKDVSVGPPMPPMPPATIRNKKRNAMATSVVAMANNPSTSAIQTVTSQTIGNMRRPPQPTPPPIYQETIKDSPPSSPSSERPLKPKMDASRIGVSCTAPHMLGNELNPESGAAARLQEQLSAELAAHAAGGSGVDPLIPPPLINKAGPSSSGSGRGGASGAQSLDQLLERQWEQGSQFLMEQAQHFDIASLLSCLHQLRTENVRLEEHVGNLLQRRDHLLAVNARLAIPLTTVTTGPPEPTRCTRENGSQVRPPPPVRAPETITSERSHQLIMREVQQKPS